MKEKKGPQRYKNSVVVQGQISTPFRQAKRSFSTYFVFGSNHAVEDIALSTEEGRRKEIKAYLVPHIPKFMIQLDNCNTNGMY